MCSSPTLVTLLIGGENQHEATTQCKCQNLDMVDLFLHKEEGTGGAFGGTLHLTAPSCDLK